MGEICSGFKFSMGTDCQVEKGKRFLEQFLVFFLAGSGEFSILLLAHVWVCVLETSGHQGCPCWP